MKRGLLAVAVLVMCGSAVLAEEAAPAAKVEAKAEVKAEVKGSTCFACAGCKEMSLTAKECCGMDMKKMNVVAIHDGVADICACEAGCKCDKVEDGKCSCGMEAVTVSLAGKCVCEKCKVIKEAAGKCACGADLVKVEAKK